MKRSPRILALVTDAFGGHGGIALYMRDVLHCLTAMDSAPSVRLVARTGVVGKDGVPQGIHWETGALEGKWAYVWTILKMIAASQRTDLVICGHINLLPLACLAAWRAHCPLVLFIYGIDAWSRPKGLLAGKLVRKVDLVLAISDITRQRFLSWSQTSPDRARLLPNAIKLERYGPGSRRHDLVARYGLEGRRVLMSLGRLSSVQRHKGVDEVIEILPMLLEEFPDLVYLVAGGGDDIERLREKAAKHGVGDRVIFTGLVDEYEKADHYRLADAFALTGRGDGFGFVLLEAMACGVPVVASMLDGSQEAVLKGELGIVVNPDDPVSLKNGLSEALQRPKGIPQGLEHFAFPNFCSRFCQSLQPLLAALP